MIDHEICGIVIFQCWLIYCIIALIVVCMVETFKKNSSDIEKIFYSLCWPLAIVFLFISYLIRKIKLNIKLKETNKIEENKRKKELVDNVLKELNIR